MKTSKEMQLKIIDKMRENVESDRPFYEDLEYTALGTTWVDEEGCIRLDDLEYRIKPQTITINGVEIPKPLSLDEINTDEEYFFVENNAGLYAGALGRFIKSLGIRFAYKTKSEAIEASKLLFGIED